MVESNLEKFLPALIGIIGRIGAVTGGEEEEEEKSMNKQQVLMNIQHIEKSLLKLMKEDKLKSIENDLKNPFRKPTFEEAQTKLNAKRTAARDAKLAASTSMPTGQPGHSAASPWKTAEFEGKTFQVLPDDLKAKLPKYEPPSSTSPKSNLDAQGYEIKQSIENTLLKLMKGGSFYGGAREPKGGVSQGKLPAGNKGYGREEEVDRQEAPLRRDMEARGKETIARRYGQQKPFVNPKSMDKADVPEPKKEKPTESGNVEDVGGVSFPAGKEGRKQMEDWWAQNFPKATGAEEHIEEMEKAGREMEIAGPDKGRDEIKFRSPVSTHPENVRMPTPEDPRTSSDVQTPSEESNSFDMGGLEARIAGKSRNKPTYDVRSGGAARSRKEEESRYSAGRPKPEVGATPSISASLKALNKMLQGGFLSKKAAPAPAGQTKEASRQRGVATQDRIAGGHAAGAQAVQGPADNTAQQIGSEIAGGLGWAIGDTIREMGGREEGTSQPRPGAPGGSAGVLDLTNKPWKSNNSADTGGDDDMPNVSSVEGLKNFVANEGQKAGMQPNPNTGGTSGIYGPTGNSFLPSSLTTAKPTQEAMVPPPKTGGFNPAEEGMKFNR